LQLSLQSCAIFASGGSQGKPSSLQNVMQNDRVCSTEDKRRCTQTIFCSGYAIGRSGPQQLVTPSLLAVPTLAVPTPPCKLHFTQPWYKLVSPVVLTPW
jgi:hypothetical protein